MRHLRGSAVLSNDAREPKISEAMPHAYPRHAASSSCSTYEGASRAGPGPDGGPARLDLAGRVGDHVSLVSLDNTLGVTTIGLRFRLRDEALPAGPARGLSNVRDAAAAEVRVRRGRILVVEVPATLPE